MFVVREMRTLVCLLLVVSTTIGAVVPAHACGCAIPYSVAPAHSADSKPAPQARPATPAPKSCCPIGAKRACCRDGAKSSCCGEQPRTDSPANQSGCACARCDCAPPHAPTAPPTPTQAATDLDLALALAATVLPGFVPPPAAGPRVTHPALVPPPADLVISLSRLTC